MRQEASKTNTFNNSMLLLDTQMPWLGELLRKHWAARVALDCKEALLWPDYAKLAREYRRAAALVGDSWLKLSPYSHRHGGASRYRVRRLCDLREVQRRGQWKVYDFAKVYEKHTRVLELLAANPTPVAEYGERYRTCFVRWYRANLAPPMSQEPSSACTAARDALPASSAPAALALYSPTAPRPRGTTLGGGAKLKKRC